MSIETSANASRNAGGVSPINLQEQKCAGVLPVKVPGELYLRDPKIHTHAVNIGPDSHMLKETIVHAGIYIIDLVHAVGTKSVCVNTQRIC